VAGNVLQEILTRIGFTVDQPSVDKAKSSAVGLKGFLLKMAAGFSVAMVGKMALNSASQMETLKAQFTTMLGTAQAANRFFFQISQFAARTPFAQMGVAQAAQTLMQFGVETKKIMPTLGMLGDIAGADQAKFRQLALVFGQIQSTGRLMGQDLLQLINAGFNPLQVMAKKSGKSMAELKQEMERGKISAEMVTDAFVIATSKGGQFYQNTANQAKTWQGVTSTALDVVTMALGEAVTQFMPLMKSFVQSLGETNLNWLVELSKQVASALQLIGQTFTETGFGEAWALFSYQIGALFEELGLFVAGPGQQTADFLRSIVRVLSFFAKIILYSAVFLIEMAKAVIWLLPSLHTVWEIIKLLLPAMAVLFGPAMIAAIWAKVAALVAENGIMVALRAVYLSSLLLGGGQLTLNGLLTASWYAMTAGIGSAATAMKAFILGNPLLVAAAAAAMAVAFAWSSINAAMEQWVEEETQKAENESVARMDTSYADLRQKKAKLQQELKQLDATGQGSSKRAEEIKGELKSTDMLIRVNRKAREGQQKDITKAQKERSSEMPDFTAALDMQNAMTTLDMQKAVEGSGANVNVKNNMDFTINAPPGKNGETGLTPSGIGAAAREAFRAQFSIELQKVLVGAV